MRMICASCVVSILIYALYCHSTLFAISLHSTLIDISCLIKVELIICDLAEMMEIMVKDNILWENLKGMEGGWEVRLENVKEIFSFPHFFF